MVKIADIEGLKENFAPQMGGLDIDMLPNSSFEDPQAVLEEFDDPLAAKVAQLRQLKHEHYADPSKIAQQFIACIDEFKDWEAYKNDTRFVCLCLDYSTLSGTPTQMFEFMRSNRIGMQCAVFYERWANYLETCGQFLKAKCTLQEGIYAHARPVTQLQQLLDDVNARHPVAETRQLASASTSHAPVIGNIGQQKTLAGGRMKFAVFNDKEGQFSAQRDEAMHDVPNIIMEKKENVQPKLPFYPAPRNPAGSRTDTGFNHAVYTDTNDEIESSESSNDMGFESHNFQSLTYAEQLVLIRKPITSQLRPVYALSGIPEVSPTSTTRIQVPGMYDEHLGMTEVFRPAGGTEVLYDQ